MQAFTCCTVRRLVQLLDTYVHGHTAAQFVKSLGVTQSALHPSGLQLLDALHMYIAFVLSRRRGKHRTCGQKESLRVRFRPWCTNFAQTLFSVTFHVPKIIYTTSFHYKMVTRIQYKRKITKESNKTKETQKTFI